MKTLYQFALLLLAIQLLVYGCDGVGYDPDTAPAGFNPDKENVQINVFVKDQKGDFKRTTSDAYGFYTATHSYDLTASCIEWNNGCDLIDAGTLWCDKHRELHYRDMAHGGNKGKENISRFGKMLWVIKVPYYDNKGHLYFSIHTFETEIKRGQKMVANIYFDAAGKRIQGPHKDTNITVSNL